MNKKALLGLSVALLLPICCYLILKYASVSAVDMPRRYLLDTVVERVEKGKMITDTLWHQTSNIRLQNQLGDTVSLYDKKGKILVVDFFFTHCGSICPKLTSNMATLQQSFIRGGNLRKKIDTSIVQFVSFTVDPERDSVPVLKAYADRFGVNHDNWWMLTGNRDSIYRFAFEELKVDKFSTEPVSPDFVHTSRFVLIDKEYRVRGYYNGLDSVSIGKLARDIGLLMLEKDKKQKSAVFSQIIDLSWLWFIIIVLVIFFVTYLRSRRKLNG
ncbi:MAG: SCO family protein [Chitinophagaceae bacterium]|nr:SCO family protein [Chitinophagaceae bacterium]MEA3425136.1 SCO family protein [Bacteroidota bacterium]MCA6454453.1 SCO family protein [Chitinophagaceae bacterium]MCA6456305.1 SCO family protein [Chitinophagaceae bacterium]MCA6460011.1 SCO family protein [Chitinophagaceae bacterium]